MRTGVPFHLLQLFHHCSSKSSGQLSLLECELMCSFHPHHYPATKGTTCDNSDKISNSRGRYPITNNNNSMNHRYVHTSLIDVNREQGKVDKSNLFHSASTLPPPEKKRNREKFFENKGCPTTDDGPTAYPIPKEHFVFFLCYLYCAYTSNVDTQVLSFVCPCVSCLPSLCYLRMVS